ncbi:MAG: hypothetical protein PHD06_01650 [Bacteroidales bacterium]|nr:hypothetical protein [Bacteroidales bacterium]MDD4383863.1 hypothetical protein [Bacteroidales bacterium]MDY0196442.1 hypothetical protein [Tenuifilaceae bacterium]
MSKLAVVLEIIWLILAFICVGFGIYITVKVGFNQSYMFFILSVVALLMYTLRRHKRKQASSN